MQQKIDHAGQVGLYSGYSVDGINEYSIAQNVLKTTSAEGFLFNLFTNVIRTQATLRLCLGAREFKKV